MNALPIRRYGVLATLIVLAACGDDGETAGAGGATTGSSGSGDAQDVPPFAKPWQLLSVGDYVEGGPAKGSFQDAYDGWTYFFTDDDEPEYLCQHDDAQLAEKMDEGDLPHGDECQAYSPPSKPLDGGAPGMWAPPIGYSDWPGTETGGCGAWATMMCNRRLGITSPDTPPTREEYEAVAFGINQKEDGGSDTIGIMAYYRSKGYCIGYETFNGSAVDYAFVSALHADGCDIKLFLSRREEPGADGKKRRSNSHIETVVEAGADSMTTNSWGAAGVIRGGSIRDFSHSEDGNRYSDNLGREGPKWPPGSTEVFMMAVCPCNDPSFEVLGATIGH